MQEDGTRIISATNDGGLTWRTIHTVTWSQVQLDMQTGETGYALILKWGNQTYESAIVITENGGERWDIVDGRLK